MEEIKGKDILVKIYVFQPWIITLSNHKIYDGIKIPVKGEATWKLDDGDFTWYKLEIYDVKYNHRVMKE